MGQQLLTASENFCPEEMHILGDAAYKLHPFLMVLFKDNVHLTPSQVRFKRVLSKTRMPVERGFGLLKCRFRRLFYLSLQKVAYGLLIIVACCVLHNICLDLEDDMNEEILHEVNQNIADIILHEVNEENQFHNAPAVQKRMNIINMLVDDNP